MHTSNLTCSFCLKKVQSSIYTIRHYVKYTLIQCFVFLGCFKVAIACSSNLVFNSVVSQIIYILYIYIYIFHHSLIGCKCLISSWLTTVAKCTMYNARAKPRKKEICRSILLSKNWFKYLTQIIIVVSKEYKFFYLF